MQKIIYVVSTLKNCAPIKQLFEIVRYMAKEEYQIIILTLSPEPENSLKEQFLSMRIQVNSLNMGRIAFLFTGKRVLEKKLLEESPNIVHTSGIRADVMMAQLQLDIPWCATVRCNVREDYINKYGRLQGNVMAQQHLNAIGKMNFPVCCSRTLKSIYEKHLHREMLAVQDGIDTQRYHYDRKERIDLRKNMRISEDTTVFVTSGHLTEGKDPLSILRAFSGLFRKNEALLYVLGDGSLRKKCEFIAGDNVKFEGHVQNVEQYLLAADIYISASLTEGLPNAVLEAGASGLSVILSDIAQHREIFPCESETVFFFPVRDIEGLRKQIRKAKQMWRQSDRTLISDKIIKQFDSKRMSKEYQELYQEILSEKRRLYHRNEESI